MGMNEPPRVRLGSLPTPCEPAPDLGALLGIDALWVKRDDLIGLSWGGNKVRTIEFLLGDLLHRRADTVVLSGGPTSNFAALMAAACARHGIAVHQVCYGRRPARAPAAMMVGARSGTVFHFTESPDRESMEVVARGLADRLRAEGRSPYVLPRGGATPVGALGYAQAAGELTRQLGQAGIASATVVVPVGSGGTMAGLVAGWTQVLDAGAAPVEVDLVGVSVSRPPDELTAAIADIAARCAEIANGCRAPSRGSHCRWRLVDGRGSGFGVVDAADRQLVDTIELRTRFLVDGTYNGKALRWLRDAARGIDGPLVYWHTGGAFGVVDRICSQGAVAAASPMETLSR